MSTLYHSVTLGTSLTNATLDDKLIYKKHSSQGIRITRYHEGNTMR